MKPGKGTNKDAKIYVGRSTTLHNLLFYAHTLYMSYIKQNNNMQQRALTSFTTIPLY